MYSACSRRLPPPASPRSRDWRRPWNSYSVDARQPDAGLSSISVWNRRRWGRSLSTGSRQCDMASRQRSSSSNSRPRYSVIRARIMLTRHSGGARDLWPTLGNLSIVSPPFPRPPFRLKYNTRQLRRYHCDRSNFGGLWARTRLCRPRRAMPHLADDHSVGKSLSVASGRGDGGSRRSVFLSCVSGEFGVYRAAPRATECRGSIIGPSQAQQNGPLRR